MLSYSAENQMKRKNPQPVTALGAKCIHDAIDARDGGLKHSEEKRGLVSLLVACITTGNR